MIPWNELSTNQEVPTTVIVRNDLLPVRLLALKPKVHAGRRVDKGKLNSVLMAFYISTDIFKTNAGLLKKRQLH